tara:strand:- start:290 stop:583 length:294 start_codon:yes stop_codon:yes gene_type:complete
VLTPVVLVVVLTAVVVHHTLMLDLMVMIHQHLLHKVTLEVDHPVQPTTVVAAVVVPVVLVLVMMAHPPLVEMVDLVFNSLQLSMIQELLLQVIVVED